MKASINGVEIEGTAQELLELIKLLDAKTENSKTEQPILPKPSAPGNKLKKTFKEYQSWSNAEDEYLLQNYWGVNEKKGRRHEEVSNHNKQIARILGRSRRAISSRYWLLKHPEYQQVKQIKQQ